MTYDRRPTTAYALLFTAGVALGGVRLATDAARPAGPLDVTAANSVHVVLAVLAAAVLAIAWTREPEATRAFLTRPLTADGWRDLTRSVLWRDDPAAARPLRFLAAVVMAYTPLRAGLQVLAGLDPDFTRTAWGGPTYAGAMAAHYLDGALLFLAASAVIATRRVRRPAHAGE